MPRTHHIAYAPVRPVTMQPSAFVEDLPSLSVKSVVIAVFRLRSEKVIFPNQIPSDFLSDEFFPSSASQKVQRDRRLMTDDQDQVWA